MKGGFFFWRGGAGRVCCFSVVPASVWMRKENRKGTIIYAASLTLCLALLDSDSKVVVVVFVLLSAFWGLDRNFLLCFALAAIRKLVQIT